MTKSHSHRLYDIMNSVLKAANCDSVTSRVLHGLVPLINMQKLHF